MRKIVTPGLEGRGRASMCGERNGEPDCIAWDKKKKPIALLGDRRGEIEPNHCLNHDCATQTKKEKGGRMLGEKGGDDKRN